MLSDEEKEILNNIKEYMQNDIDKGYHKFVYNDLGSDFKCIDCINAIDNVLNLIEKQQKEIEELKENNKNLEDELNKYIVKMSDEQYRRLVNIIRDEINKLWEDKIKAKIEQLDYNDIANFERRCKQEVLQSLLEKE